MLIVQNLCGTAAHLLKNQIIFPYFPLYAKTFSQNEWLKTFNLWFFPVTLLSPGHDPTKSASGTRILISVYPSHCLMSHCYIVKKG